MDKPGPVLCPSCGHDYIDWLNAEEVLSYLHKTDPDFKEYR